MIAPLPDDLHHFVESTVWTLAKTSPPRGESGVQNRSHRLQELFDRADGVVATGETHFQQVWELCISLR